MTAITPSVLTIVPSPADQPVLWRHRFGWIDAVMLAGSLGFFFALPEYLALATTTFISALFALSLDLVVGFAGIDTLGHAAFFGLGAYAAALVALHVSPDPLVGLALAAVLAAVLGLGSGVLLFRTRGLTSVMLTLAFSAVLLEVANSASGWTGGADGLSGFDLDSIFGLFRLDLAGRTAYWYCLAVLIVAYVACHVLVNSPFGLTTRGFRSNKLRAQFIGVPVLRRQLTLYAVAGALAGVAGALSAQVTGVASLDGFAFLVSGNVLIMLAIGGAGRLYGAIIGAIIFVVFSDRAAAIDPFNWLFALGLLLVLVVRFAPNGVIGLISSRKAT